MERVLLLERRKGENSRTMIIEIKEHNITTGQINSLRETFMDLFQTDFTVELEMKEKSIIRFKDA